MKICIVIGTRPEIIKACSLIRFCKENKIDFFLIHTGQHYSYEMDKLLFQELDLDPPKYNLEAGGADFRFQISIMTAKIKSILMKEFPDIMLVIGDTTSMLAGSLIANKLRVKLGHVEAGLRSHDLTMREEINRIMADNIAELLFAPTAMAKNNLIEEGISKDRIFITGNTVVDALYQNIKIANMKFNALEKLNLHPKKYIVLTAHRQENVDVYQRLKGILDGIKKVYDNYKVRIVWPLHPRTDKMLKKFNLEIPKVVTVIPPIGYLEFLQLQEKALLIMTDSGGLQEESCILKVPCVTLRDNTERPETLKVGSNVLVGVEPDSILKGVKAMWNKKADWENPFGDGHAAENIINVVLKNK